ncbi:SMI1/KNR4 family protein [Streptomyces indicus]|uniref:SMI1/KNR4 family protein n=1 Tax=Streptomyces indicus TaxID=417292 RepID=UPI000A7A20F9|nr:SMI1/KNR4 family protein [Streptomyces indicus]
MLRDLVAEFPFLELRAPAAPSDLTAIEARLGTRLPDALRALLSESDGLEGEYGEGVVWPAARILEDNRMFRSHPDFPELYESFDPLLFFGDNGGGDQFAFVRTPERDDVFVWDHETDERNRVVGSLGEYVRRALSSGGGDWYR